MADQHDDLSGISKIFDMKMETARSNFVAINAQIGELELLLSTLKADSGIGGVPDANLSYASIGGDLAWLTWVERRRSAILNDISKLRACREGAREELRRMSGQAKSFEAIVERRSKEQHIASGRRKQKQLEFFLVAAEMRR